MKGKAKNKRQRVVLTVNTQLTLAQDIKIFKLIPELDIIQEVGVEYAGTVTRKEFEKTGDLKPRNDAKDSK